MPRIRTIKPEFPQSETVGRLSRDARLLFVQLWTIADDAGRLRGASRMLASLLYPYDDDAPALMDGWLAELEEKDCIRRYEAEGSQYIEIINWLKHQKIDRASESRLPSYREGSTSPREDSRASDADLGPRTRTKDQGDKTARSAASAVKPESIQGYAFEGVVLKLSPKHFSDWTSAFAALDLRAELVARDAWLASDRATPEDKKRWFISTSKYLANRNMEAKSKVQALRPEPQRGIAGII